MHTQLKLLSFDSGLRAIRRFSLRLFCLALILLALNLNASTKGSMNDYTLDYTTAVDVKLQKELESIDQQLRDRYEMSVGQTAVGVLDLKNLRLAMIDPDRIEYAASIPKIGILLAYFQLKPDAVDTLDSETRHRLELMTKVSSNEWAAHFSRELGLKEIQKVLDSYDFYDAEKGGGLWVGKHYGRDEERYGDPVGDNSHGATVRQLLRFYLLLEQGKLVSPEVSERMKEIFAAPEIEHDDIKFVKGLGDREVQLLRKWGSWRNWLHDSAIIIGPDRHYILVGLTEHPKGDDYLVDLAVAVDDLFVNGADRLKVE
ncbi:MAG TPA: serine hydrolase [Opitutales bacterium]|nr:serine hydrolase [Opitutales bacterium]